MPRVAGSNRGTGLSLRNSENVGNVTNVKGKVVVDTKIAVKNSKGKIETGKRSSTGVKRHAEESSASITDCSTKTRRRAALEEITNVSSERMRNVNIPLPLDPQICTFSFRLLFIRHHLIQIIILGESWKWPWRRGKRDKNFEKPNEKGPLGHCA